MAKEVEGPSQPYQQAGPPKELAVADKCIPVVRFHPKSCADARLNVWIELRQEAIPGRLESVSLRL